MGRFIPRHRLKAGALALHYAPAASVGRSVTSRGTPDAVRIGVQAAFVGLPYPPRSRPLRPIGWRFRRFRSSRHRRKTPEPGLPQWRSSP